MMVAAIHHGECESQAEPEREDERPHRVLFGSSAILISVIHIRARVGSSLNGGHLPSRRLRQLCGKAGRLNFTRRAYAGWRENVN
jgi:hypothetical protein